MNPTDRVRKLNETETHSGDVGIRRFLHALVIVRQREIDVDDPAWIKIGKKRFDSLRKRLGQPMVERHVSTFAVDSPN